MSRILVVCLVLASACNQPDGHTEQPPPDAGPSCGNGTRDGSEKCDGADLGGATCGSLSLGTGTLACSASCDFDTHNCHATCQPRTCSAAGAECGVVDDGCGMSLACGTCSGTETCGGGGMPNQCGMGPCTARTCADAGAECGVIDDGCGHALTCGTCTGSETCGGGGVPNQCGGGTTTASPWTAIATGSWHTCGLRDDGTLWCWGRNNAGQLGLGTAGNDVDTPTQVGTSHGWTKVTAGSQHTCGIQYDHMYCWGDNSNDQIGDGTTTDRVVPTLIASAKTWKDVAAGFSSTCAWDNVFEVYCWGNNDYQQIEQNVLGPVETPTYRGNAETLSLGGGHECHSYSPDRLYCQGLNSSRQVGSDSVAQVAPTGAVITPMSNWQWHGVWAGGRHTCGFGFVGLLVCWGDNTYGQLGHDAALGDQAEYVDGLSDWATMGVGDSHTCGIKTNGNLLCWGANDNGQLGDATMDNSDTPRLIGSGFATVAGGFSHTCALRTDHSLFCWGDNTYGALGFAGGSVSTPHEVQ